MNIRTRLSKLEEAAGPNKPLFEMSDAELERFIGQQLGLPSGAPITNEMLWQIINDKEVRGSRYSHEEALDLMEGSAKQ